MGNLVFLECTTVEMFLAELFGKEMVVFWRLMLEVGFWILKRERERERRAKEGEQCVTCLIGRAFLENRTAELKLVERNVSRQQETIHEPLSPSPPPSVHFLPELHTLPLQPLGIPAGTFQP